MHHRILVSLMKVRAGVTARVGGGVGVGVDALGFWGGVGVRVGVSLQVGQVAQKPSALRLHLAQITLLLARAAIGRGARGLGELQECRQPMVNAGGHHLRLRVGLARPDRKSGQLSLERNLFLCIERSNGVVELSRERHARDRVRSALRCQHGAQCCFAVDADGACCW